MTIDLSLEKKRMLAADAVLSGRNSDALALLDELLDRNPHDADALLQRAHVYWLTGDLEKAQKDYRRVLKYDPLNSIAQKKLSALKLLTQKQLNKDRVRGTVIPINSLIEEPGKAKALRLTNVGKHDEIAHLAVGEQLIIKTRKHKIELRDVNDTFVGNLPDDISKRLMGLMEKGAFYETYILSVDKSEVKVLVREQKKPARIANMPSFVIEDQDDEHLAEEGDEAAAEQSPDEEDSDLDLDDESIVVHGNNEPDDEEEEEKDQDADTYREYEE